MRFMLIRKALLYVALVALVVTATCKEKVNNATPTPVGTQPPVTAQPMPPVSEKSINNLGWDFSNGKRELFSSYKGKVLVLDFYATWCGPCRNSVPHLIELQDKYGPKGVDVIGLNVGGPDDIPRVPDFQEELQIKYPLAVPDEELIGLLLTGSDAIPQTFVFGRDGQLVRRFVGFGPDTGEGINKAVEAALRTAAD